MEARERSDSEWCYYWQWEAERRFNWVIAGLMNQIHWGSEKVDSDLTRAGWITLQETAKRRNILKIKVLTVMTNQKT